MTIGILAAVFKSDFEGAMKKQLEESIRVYNQTDIMTWDKIQMQVKFSYIRLFLNLTFGTLTKNYTSIITTANYELQKHCSLQLVCDSSSNNRLKSIHSRDSLFAIMNMTIILQQEICWKKPINHHFMIFLVFIDFCSPL